MLENEQWLKLGILRDEALLYTAPPLALAWLEIKIQWEIEGAPSSLSSALPLSSLVFPPLALPAVRVKPLSTAELVVPLVVTMLYELSDVSASVPMSPERMVICVEASRWLRSLSLPSKPP